MTAPTAGHRGPRPVRVLIVDDHPLFRQTVRRLLTLAEFSVIGEAASGLEALTAAETLRPDWVLLDIQLPDLDGFRVARELARMASPPAVILVSNRDRSDYGALIDRSDVAGFVAKADLAGDRLHDLLDRYRSQSHTSDQHRDRDR